MINKVLRDRETQLKGTDLSCSLRGTRAFRPSRFLFCFFRAPKVAELRRCLHFCPDRQAAQRAELSLCLSLSVSFCPALRRHETRRVVKSLLPNRLRVQHFVLFSSAASNVSAVMAPKIPVVVTGQLEWWPFNVICKSLVFKSPLRQQGVDTRCVSGCAVFSHVCLFRIPSSMLTSQVR